MEKGELRPLSFSSLKSFQTCKYKWYRQYITQDIPEERTPWLAIGSAIHYALEQWRFNGGDRHDMLAWALEYLKSEPIELNEKHITDVKTLIYSVPLPRAKVGILLGVEVMVEGEILDGVKITGIIDKIERVGDTIVVTDYKTNRKIDVRSYFQQLAIYDILLREQLPIEELGLKTIYELMYVRYSKVFPFRITEDYREKVKTRLNNLASYIIQNRDNIAAWPKLPKKSADCRWCPLQKECWGDGKGVKT